MGFRKYISLLLVAMVLSNCSTTKDRWINRQYHETTAHYNAFFNGEEALKEAVSAFEKSEEYDFEALLPIYYWPHEKQAPQMFAKMDRALEKSAKVIKNHSMVFRGEQKNDYVFKAYLLIARARFYKNEWIQCIEATSYMEDQFRGIEKADDEVFWAQLLAAQTHIRMDNAFQAEQILDEIYTKELPKAMLFEVQKTIAALHIHKRSWERAQHWVESAAELAPNKSQKVRLTYLNAQLYALLKKGYESALAYEAVLKLHPNDYDITFSAQIKRAENFDVYMEDITIIEKDLEKMLRDDKNISYRDQIYYVWALKRLGLEHFTEAEKLLVQSIQSSVENPKQKGKSYLALAGVAFDFRDFVPAQAYYDSALAVLPAGYGGLDTLQHRKSVLDELVFEINSIMLEDSLQAMYGMSEMDLREKFRRFIAEKQKREEEARRRAELAEMRAEQNALLANTGPQAISGGEWYFFNSQVRTSGLASFKRTWGDRPLEDHWRTKDKPAQGFGGVVDLANADDGADSTEVALPSNDNSVEYYLSRVLLSQEDYNQSLIREATAKAELGFIYKDGLRDLVAADLAWLDYLEEFESYAQLTPKVLYGLYLLRGEQLDTENQEKTKEKLLKEYPNSPYSALLRGEMKGPVVPREEQEAYEAAFAAFVSGGLKTAQMKLDLFIAQYPKTSLRAKAQMLQAFIYGADEKEDEVVAALKGVVNDYTDSEESTVAAQILALLMDDNEGRKQDFKGSGDQKVQKIDFPEQPNAPHKFILAIPAENSNINDLRNALADFNKEHFKFDNLRIQNIFYDQATQLVIVSGLRTKEKAKVYLNTFSTLGGPLEQYYPKARSEAFYINNPNFGKVYRDKVLKEYIQHFKKL
ncbi:MAG: hypothetical protein ABWW61_03155 [Flavobacteriales bacterium]